MRRNARPPHSGTSASGVGKRSVTASTGTSARSAIWANVVARIPDPVTRLKKTVTIGLVSFQIQGGDLRRIKSRLTKKGLKLLRFHRTLVVPLIVETVGNPPIVRHIRITPFKR